MKKITILLIMVAITFQISISEVKAIEPSSSYIYEGIDVSKWQGNIDFEKVANDGIEIVYIKATEGTYYENPYLESSYQVYIRTPRDPVALLLIQLQYQFCLSEPSDPFAQLFDIFFL